MIVRTLSALSILAFLAACGGGGGPVQQDPDQDQIGSGDSGDPVEEGDGVAAPPGGGTAGNPDDEFDDRFGTDDPDEEPVDDGSELDDTLEGSEQETITLTGVAFIRRAAPGASSLELRDGTVTISDGTRELNGQLIELTGDVPGTFAQASSFLQESEGAVGIIGIPTDLVAMPTVGSATFAGGATGLVIVGDSGFELRNGSSTVTADFAAGTLRADLGEFTSVSTVSGSLADAPFETITLEGAIIDGTAFSGGTISTGGGQSVSQVVGNGATSLSQGQFYGTNDTGTAPTEVGGVVFTEGESGLIYGSFIGAE